MLRWPSEKQHFPKHVSIIIIPHSHAFFFDVFSTVEVLLVDWFMIVFPPPQIFTLNILFSLSSTSCVIFLLSTHNVNIEKVKQVFRDRHDTLGGSHCFVQQIVSIKTRSLKTAWGCRWWEFEGKWLGWRSNVWMTIESLLTLLANQT